ncbi:hypothetical protein AB0D57_43695, partial [Streptomyces sp. NPDC048275]
MRPRERSEATAHGTAASLVATLPRLRELHGRTVVVVAGDHVLADEKLRHAFCGDIGFLRYSGVRAVVVHILGRLQREVVAVDVDTVAVATGVSGTAVGVRG